MEAIHRVLCLQKVSLRDLNFLLNVLIHIDLKEVQNEFRSSVTCQSQRGVLLTANSNVPILELYPSAGFDVSICSRTVSGSKIMKGVDS